ncbi:MAG TPA: flagellar motor switch protein FliG [Pyrinomonadaceae bacterium]|nr:flagellar motor switch protein FliG [Pyrinomonadaceae bacterium]
MDMVAAEPIQDSLASLARPSDSLNGISKAAVFCIAMGEDVASEIFKFLDEEEVQLISRELSALSRVSSEIADDVVEEFHQLLVAQSYVASGGVDYAKRLLFKAYGPETSKRLLEKMTRSLESTAGFEALQRVDPQQLSKLFQNEHPQTIAVVLAHLDASRAAATLEYIPEAQRTDIVLRMSNLQAISQDVVRRISMVLDQKLKTVGPDNRQSVGGIRSVAEICNHLDREVTRGMLEEIEANQPNLALEIRNLMISFDDLLLIDDAGIREILQKVDKKVLGLALKGTVPDLQNKFFSNMSSKAVELMKEEMDYMGQVKLKEVSAAQRQVIDVVRELDEKGIVNLSGGGGDEVYVS